MVTRKDLKKIETLIVRFIEFYRFANRTQIAGYEKHHRVPTKLFDIIAKSQWKANSELHTTLSLLNSGDCPVVAMAVGEVLRLSGVEDITYQANGGHYYFSVMVKGYNKSAAFLLVDSVKQIENNFKCSQRVYFDAFNPKGTVIESSLLKPNSIDFLRLREGDALWLAENAFPDDHLGKEWIEQFVKFYYPNYKYPYPISNRASDVY